MATPKERLVAFSAHIQSPKMRVHSITENKKGGLLFTLLLNVDFKDFSFKVTKNENVVNVSTGLYRTYDIILEGDEKNGFRVMTMETDADKVIAELKKWREENKDKYGF